MHKSCTYAPLVGPWIALTAYFVERTLLNIFNRSLSSSWIYQLISPQIIFIPDMLPHAISNLSLASKYAGNMHSSCTWCLYLWYYWFWCINFGGQLLSVTWELFDRDLFMSMSGCACMRVCFCGCLTEDTTGIPLPKFQEFGRSNTCASYWK